LPPRIPDDEEIELTTTRSSTWRQRFKVHPAADVFPMMTDVELDALAEDIKANGLRQKVVFSPGVDHQDGQMIDSRNRIAAMERAGIEFHPCTHGVDYDGDPISFIVSANLKRRHMTKEQIADVIVALAKIKAAEKPGQAGPVSGGRGKRNPVKAKAVEINKALPKEDQVSERTIKRSIAKAEGRPKKPTCPKCHGSGTITGKKTGTTVDCDCRRGEAGADVVPLPKSKKKSKPTPRSIVKDVLLRMSTAASKDAFAALFKVESLIPTNDELWCLQNIGNWLRLARVKAQSYFPAKMRLTEACSILKLIDTLEPQSQNVLDEILAEVERLRAAQNGPVVH
jgi:hypothetical protein